LILDFNKNYRNKSAAHEILEARSENISQEVIKEISLSPSIGLMMDESTDFSSIQYLAINIKYIVDAKVKEKFCGVFELRKANAENIFSTLIIFLINIVCYTKFSLSALMVPLLLWRKKRMSPNILIYLREREAKLPNYIIFLKNSSCPFILESSLFIKIYNYKFSS